MTPISGSWRRIARSLLSGRRSRASTVIVPVPCAESALAAALGDDAGNGSGELPPHVTVLYPFVPASEIDSALEVALADALARFAPFPFSLDRVASFPGVLYLEPRPSAPFVELTEAICVRWPEFPPYRGEFDVIVPHLTVSTGEVPSGLVGRLEPLLPIKATAREVWLLTQETGQRWEIRKRFHLGNHP